MAAELRHRPSSASRGKREESRPMLGQIGAKPSRHPKAVMAAASMDSKRSSAAMECFAHSESAGYRGRCREEEERKEEGDCQVDPGPTCQQARKKI